MRTYIFRMNYNDGVDPEEFKNCFYFCRRGNDQLELAEPPMLWTHCSYNLIWIFLCQSQSDSLLELPHRGFTLPEINLFGESLSPTCLEKV